MTHINAELPEAEELISKNNASVIHIETVAIAPNKPTAKVLGTSPRAVFTQVIMTILANFSILSPGMGYSYPAITFDSLTNQSDPMAITREQASWFASVSAINIPIGSLICGYILDAYGRKVTLVVLNIMSIISWSIMAYASDTNRDTMYIQILISRILMGILTGISTAPAGVYGAEVAHKNLRGRLLVLSTLFTAVGMLITYFLGFLWPNNWRLIASIACGISVFSIIVLFIIPETPSWLASKGRINAAEKSLRTFKGLPRKGSFFNSELRIDIDFLRQQCHRLQGGADSPWRSLRRPEVYKPIFIMITFFMFQQTSGIFVIMVYAVQFSKSSGISINPFLCSIFIGLTRVIATIIIGFTMDILGRRKPVMVSGLLTAICMFGIYGYAMNPDPILSWMPVALIIAYVFSSALGLLTLPFTMNSEVYPQNVRGFAGGLSLSVAFAISFGVLKLYPSLAVMFGNQLFIVFGCMSLLSIVFTYFFLPETKGKTLDEIRDLFIKPDKDTSTDINLSDIREEE